MRILVLDQSSPVQTISEFIGGSPERDIHRRSSSRIVFFLSNIGCSFSTSTPIQASMAGIFFAKLSRPKARSATVLYSEKAAISLRNGLLRLMFRCLPPPVPDCLPEELPAAGVTAIPYPTIPYPEWPM